MNFFKNWYRKSQQSPELSLNMARTAHEVAVIILNIGQSADSTFMTKAKECMLKLLESKIFTKPKDEVALFLMGTEESKNGLYEPGSDQFAHISSATGFVVPTWDLLRILRNDIKATKHHSDWLDALIVAMDFIETETTLVDQLFIDFITNLNPYPFICLGTRKYHPQRSS